MDGYGKAKRIEERNMDLLMAKVETRATVCDYCRSAVYIVWDESREKAFFTICACGIVPQAWDY